MIFEVGIVDHNEFCVHVRQTRYGSPHLCPCSFHAAAKSNEILEIPSCDFTDAWNAGWLPRCASVEPSFTTITLISIAIAAIRRERASPSRLVFDQILFVVGGDNYGKRGARAVFLYSRSSAENRALWPPTALRILPSTRFVAEVALMGLLARRV